MLPPREVDSKPLCQEQICPIFYLFVFLKIIISFYLFTIIRLVSEGEKGYVN